MPTVVSYSLFTYNICNASWHKILLDSPLMEIQVWGNTTKKTWSSTDPWAGPGHSEVPHPFHCPCNMGSTWLSHFQKLLQGHSLEIVMCWKLLHGICDCNQLRPLQAFKIWCAGVGIHPSCCHSRHASYASSLLCKFPLLASYWLIDWRERERERERGRRRERKSQACSILGTEPNVGLDLMILGSWPELKSRLGHSMTESPRCPSLAF